MGEQPGSPVDAGLGPPLGTGLGLQGTKGWGHPWVVGWDLAGAGLGPPKGPGPGLWVNTGPGTPVGAESGSPGRCGASIPGRCWVGTTDGHKGRTPSRCGAGPPSAQPQLPPAHRTQLHPRAQGASTAAGIPISRRDTNPFLMLPMPKKLHFPLSSAPHCGFAQKFSPVNKYASVLQNSPKAKHLSLLFSCLIASSSVFFPFNIISTLSQAGNNYIVGKNFFFPFSLFFP